MDLGNLGFDFHAVLTAIEDRFLSSGSCAVIGDRPPKHVVHALMDDHVLMHAVPTLDEKYGFLVPAPRCPIWPCPSAGLAFAAFELRWYAINAFEQEVAELFDLAAARLPLWGQLAEEFREEATRRREALFSVPLQTRSLRRPPAALAQAVAQQLENGGLTDPEIAMLMGCTPGCVEKRCTAPERRSVLPFDEYYEFEGDGAA